ncbi:MAG: hypothetical protein ABSF70_19760 [Terracidiphilus sp.]|jgi:hypothetical protein
MSERSDILKKLVVNGHVDVTERHVLGVVGKQEVAEVVKLLLWMNGVFPDHRGAKGVYEGATLVQARDGVQITWERAYPRDPFTVAERRTESIKEVDTAIEKFIESEWSDGIDGVKLK